MEIIDKPEEIVTIKFHGREITILKRIAETNMSIPEAVHNFSGNLSKEEVRKFLKDIQHLLMV